MKTTTVVMVAALAAFVAGPSAAEETGRAPGFELIGLAVARPDPSNEYGGSAVLGMQAGIVLHLRSVHPDRHLLEVDRDASRLGAFTDDKGAALGDPKEWLGPFAKVSDDAHTCTIEVRSEKLPTAGAREVTVRGTVAIRAGADERTASQPDVELKKGAKITAGPAPLTISKVGAPDWGEGAMQIELTSDRDIDAIRSFEFRRADGRVVKHRQTSSSTMTFGTRGTWTRTLVFDEKVEKVAVDVAWFGRMETVQVPLDVKAGIGL